MTLEEYEAMLAEQEGGCAICGRPPTDEIALHVDHDHASGRVRGLLCFRCNNALGDFEESPVLLDAASEYVTTHALRRRLGELKVNCA